MSTSSPDSRRAASPRSPAPNDSREEQRGRGNTVIAEKVFEKIAGQAAAEVAASRGRSGGFLGIGDTADADARPKVDVNLTSDSVDLDLAIGIAYPGSIRTAVARVRDRVSRTVQDLTGVPVHRVDIDVTFLTTPGGNDRGARQESLR